MQWSDKSALEYEVDGVALARLLTYDDVRDHKNDRLFTFTPSQRAVIDVYRAVTDMQQQVRANFWTHRHDNDEDESFVVVESRTNRVIAEGDGHEFDQVTLLHRRDPSRPWLEVTAWVDDEWRTPGNGAFGAVVGVIAKVAAGVEIGMTSPEPIPPQREH